MIIERTKDKEAISRIFNHPKVYKWITEDGCPKVYEPPMDDRFIYLMDDTKNGVVKIDPFINSVCCYVHIGFKPELWGKGDEFVRKGLAWLFKNTRYQKIISITPVYIKLAIRLVRKNGFTQEGLIKKSFLKNWVLHDQVIYGLTKEDYLKGALWQQA